MATGGGAAAAAYGIITFAQSQAATLAAQSRSDISQAISELSSASGTTLAPPTSIAANAPFKVAAPLDASGKTTIDALGTIKLPFLADPEVDASAESIKQSYTDTSDEVIETLNQLFVDFFQTHFPPDTYVLEAETWVTNSIAEGGSGVNLAVEAQLWERARARAFADADRAQAELSLTWASRRFPVPPGAFLHASLAVTRSTQDAVAEAARTQAIETFKAELENVRFAVERAVQMRTLAMQSAGEYIRTMALGPQIGQGMSTVVPDAQAKLATILREHYRAQVEVVEFRHKARADNMALNNERERSQWKVKYDAAIKKSEAAMEAAKMTGNMAAASLNGVHAQASVSGSDVTSVNVEG